MSYFTVEQLVNLSFSSNLLYVLPDAVKKLLVELESCLEITDTPASTEQSERRDNRYSNPNNANDSRRTSEDHSVRHHRNRYDLDVSAKKRDFRQNKTSGSEWRTKEDTTAVGSEWESMRTFKATKIATKTGIEKTVNDIRISLNKISVNNYDKQRDAVVGLVNGYFESSSEDEITEENTRRISRAIFDIASTNKFYSEIYAKLYKELVAEQSVFADLLKEFVSGFTSMENVPVYVDPDADYDGFCVYSKACDIRKSTSTFLVNCLKMELIDSDKISDILCEFVKYVETKRTEEGMVKLVEEIVENVYIIATLCSKELSVTAKWREYVLPTIKRIIAEFKGQFPSMSNRANFKLMDLLEKI